MSQSIIGSHEAVALAQEIDRTLAHLANVFAKLSEQHPKAATGMAFRRALAAHALHGGYKSDDLPPEPMALRVRRFREREKAAA